MGGKPNPGIEALDLIPLERRLDTLLLEGLEKAILVDIAPGFIAPDNEINSYIRWHGFFLEGVLFAYLCHLNGCGLLRPIGRVVPCPKAVEPVQVCGRRPLPNGFAERVSHVDLQGADAHYYIRPDF